MHFSKVVLPLLMALAGAQDTDNDNDGNGDNGVVQTPSLPVDQG